MTTTATLSDPNVATALAACAAPLLAFAAIFLGARRFARLSAGLSIGAVTVSLAGAVFLLAANWHAEAPQVFSASWLVSDAVRIPVGVLLDPISLLMMTVVAVICFLVQIYSLGYMAGDPGFSRYYGFMSLFAWAMLSLTLSSSLFQLYVFWELVGLSSYLLIGFWYEKFSASQAGKKAFVMTRAGDVAFMLGLFVLLLGAGTLDVTAVNGPAAARMNPSLITLSALLIFGGIVGKSAQFPLLTWLPDAMEGPTPVSALLHSATMVAAGVFLFARLFPFFRQSPAAMGVFLVIGTVSMLLSSTMAMVSRDIKQVWAYSTISQLGFMIMGLAAGSFFAGVFHLTTHAGFKALLFLCSGVVIHALDTNDMFEIARKNGRRLKLAMVCMTLAAAALSGIPPLSGFFSKESILAALADLDNPIWLAAALLGVFLTAYYAFRLIFIILFPRPELVQPEAGGGHGSRHGADTAMGSALVVLAAATLGLGFAAAPLARFLSGDPAAAHPGPHLPWLPYAGLGLAAGGLLLAWFEFGRPAADQKGFVERVPALAALFANRWYIDVFYARLISRLVDRGLAWLCAKTDQRVIDAGLDAASRHIIRSSGVLSALQSGMIQHRLLVLFAVVVMLGLYFIA
ncbi:MAG: NADH-quinone oxidoreductase subunit L [Desulfobacterales bacterium]|nr:NADH-quinone oxidoreductase subunit L [Desulfobacterales bacterium]